MAVKSPLRRWMRFFPAFGAIDAAIESALGCSRDRHRQVRADLVMMLSDAAGGGGGGAEHVEELCALLDQTMVEALQTLQLVAVTSTMVTSTDIARAVAGLRRHASGQVRHLSQGIFDGWRAKMEDDLVMVRAALEKLPRTPQEDEPVDAAPSPGDAAPSPGDARSDHESTVSLAEMEEQAAKVPDPELAKKMPPGVCCAGDGDHRVRSEKTGDEKRKHPGSGSQGPGERRL